MTDLVSFRQAYTNQFDPGSVIQILPVAPGTFLPGTSSRPNVQTDDLSYLINWREPELTRGRFVVGQLLGQAQNVPLRQTVHFCSQQASSPLTPPSCQMLQLIPFV